MCRQPQWHACIQAFLGTMTSLRDGQDCGEQRGAGRSTELQRGVEHGVPIRRELMVDAGDGVRHDIREAEGVPHSEDEIERRHEHGRQIHGEA